MKKFLLLGIIVLATLNLYSQKCGDHIELLGIGIKGKTTATITIDDGENVKGIFAEVVYKSKSEPFTSEGDPLPVIFSTPAPNAQSVAGKPEQIFNSGNDPDYVKYVFRAALKGPAGQVDLVLPAETEGFYSFALYIHRNDGLVQTVKAGELVHVYHNEDDVNDPLSKKKLHDVTIKIPLSENLRDITFRFGITELNAEDGRLAIFKFKGLGVTEETVMVESYDADAGDSYIIQEVTLTDVPGTISEITMTMLSKNPDKNVEGLDRGGDSFIAGIVLADFPCEEYESELLCSYTQGFYGNAGGKHCGEMSTTDLLKELLFEDPLVMGHKGTEAEPGNSFTIVEAECVLKLLPGGGPSKVLIGDASCEIPDSYESNKQGRLKNTLLAQGITLTLNTRLSPKLLDFPVDEEEFVTMVAMECMNPDAGGVPGTEMVHAFSSEIVEYLGPDADIEDLLNLVNGALAGEDISPLSLSQVGDAAGLVNEAFDECVVVKGYAEITPVDEEVGATGEQKEVEDPERKNALTGVSDNKEEVLGIYPNPVSDHFYLDIPLEIEDVRQAAIYSISGVKVMDLQHFIQQGTSQAIEINVSHLNKGIYFLRIEMAGESLTRRFGIQ